MAIYIKGVELPKDDDYMILTVYSDGVVYLRKCKGELCLEDSTNATDIPEPHGRLIDADVYKSQLQFWSEYDDECLDKTPTVIERSE